MNTTDDFKTYNWVGLHDSTYLTNIIDQMDNWTNIDTSKTLDLDEEFSQKIDDMIEYFDNYTDKIKSFQYYKIVYPNITNYNLTNRQIPIFFRVSIKI